MRLNNLFAFVVAAVAVLVAIAPATEAFTPSDMVGWAANFSAAIEDFAENRLNVSAVQDLFVDAAYVDDNLVGQDIITDLQDDLSTLITKKRTALENLRGDLAQLFMTSKTDAEAGNCEYYDSSSPSDVASLAMSYNDYFHQPVSMVASTVKMAPGVSYSQANVDVRFDVCLTRAALDQTFRQNAANDRELAWQYFGTQNGIFTGFPGKEWSKASSGAYNEYDPRFRPWYVNAASGPKDVVIVIDTSGSMSTLVSGGVSRLSVAQGAVNAILDTLTPDDYVSVINFATGASVVPLQYFDEDGYNQLCTHDTLVKATPDVISAYKTAVNELTPIGSTNFYTAFDKAFTVFDTSVAAGMSSGCQKAIVFLTDGVSTSADPMQLIATANAVHNAAIFTYGFGAGADPVLIKQIACANNGVNTMIPDGGDLRSQMASYYQYYAYGIYTTDVSWTPVYFDSSGLGMVITASVPVYNQSLGTNLVGVAGVDIPITELINTVDNTFISKDGYAFLINTDGEVISHPRWVPDGGFESPPLYTDISDVESATQIGTGNEIFSAIRTRMLEASTTPYCEPAVLSNQVLSTGDGGTRSRQVATRYCYAKVLSNSPFVVGIVLPESDITGKALSSAITSAIDSYYHRIDLYTEEPELSALNAQFFNDSGENLWVSYEKSTFKAAPTNFEDPAEYLNVNFTEDANRVSLIHQAINDFPTNVGFNSNVRSEVRLSSGMEAVFKEDFDANITLFKYFGFSSGIFRAYPGHASSRPYNPTRRPWYARALSHPLSNAVSTPYADYASGLKVVTLSRVIYEGYTPQPFDSTDPSAGVLGFDFFYEAFAAIFQSTVPCASEKCWLMDSAGYLVAYDTFAAANALNEDLYSNVFVGEEEPTLYEALVDDDILVESSYEDFTAFQVCTSFEVDEDLFSVDPVRGGTMGGASGCHTGTYYVSPVPQTNLYLVVVDNYAINSACDPEEPQCIDFVSEACFPSEELPTAACLGFLLTNEQIEEFRPADQKCIAPPTTTTEDPQSICERECGDDEGCDVCGTGGEVICCFSEGVECRTVRDETCSDILRGVVGSASGLAPSLVVAAVAAVAGLVALLSIEL